MGQGSAKNLAAISGVTITGTPSTGQVLTATSTSSANWQTVIIPGPVVVFKPGGVATENIYVTEATLATAIAAINGPVTILFDLSSVSFTYTFTTVGSLNLGSKTSWVGNLDPGVTTALIFANGTTLPNPPLSLSGNINIQVSQAATVCTLTVSPTTTYIYGAGGLSSTSGLFVDATGLDWVVWMHDISAIGGGTAPLTAGTLQIFASDGVSIFANTGAIGAVNIIALSPGVLIDSGYYPLTLISGLFVDESSNAVTTIPPASLNMNVGYILQGDTLYWSDGTVWTPLTGGNAKSAGTATYTKTSFSTNTTVLLDELGHSFAIPVGKSYNLNIRTLITGPNGQQPAVFVDELIIQGAAGTGNFHTILDNASVKSFTGGHPWTVTYALTGSTGASTLTITVNKNAGPSPMNAISLVTFVQIVGSADTSGP